MKILLAEDDLKMAEYLTVGLVENGHSVDHVADGRDALSYCLYNDCDMVILDRMMPGMDGLSVLKALITSGQSVQQIAEASGISVRRVQQTVGFAFLSPDIVRQVVEGRQPPFLTADGCLKHEIPVDWAGQTHQFSAT